MIKLDTLEKRVKVVYLGIGSNLGNKIHNIEKAKALLLENNISFILQKKNIIMGKTELDITDDVLKIIDKEVSKIKFE